MSSKQWRCSRCGNTENKPESVQAQEAGFMYLKHCGLIANNLGRLVECKRQDDRFRLCEECEVYWSFAKKTDKVGYK